MTFLNNISKEEILKMPVVAFTGKIIIIEDSASFDKYYPMLMSNRIWGFDTETKPCFKKGKSNQNQVSLLQLSIQNTCFLFRLKDIGMPDRLLSFFSNPNIIKVGLSIKDDLAGLRKLRNFKEDSFVDLQNLVKYYGIEELGLRKIAAIVLNKRVSKTQQLTNWEAENLSEKQQIYAATDAWVCREVYLKLINNE